MNLSSRYLFARTISAGSVPPVEEIIFFENGVFDRKYIPTGFDFENNTLSIASEAEDELWKPRFEYINKNEFENGGHADHLDDGTIFFTYSYAANNEESFTLDHNIGYLVYNHPTYRVAINRFNSFAELGCKIPVCNLSNTYNYICIRCRYVSSGIIANNSGVVINILKREGGSLIYTLKGASARVRDDRLYEKDWVNVVIDNTNFPEPIDFFSFYFDARLQSYDIEVGDIPFRIEVSKIWFTNTRPE